MDLFRVRLNCVDNYQAPPTKFDPPLFGSLDSTQHRDGPKVSVIRVFGSTETGQKVCAHIHGALPYLYIEYEGSLERREVDFYIQKLRVSIDHALAVSYRRNAYDGKAVFVGHITLVKGIPFFGYHVGYRYFLKIYMLNPSNMTRFTDLLYQGAIMKRVFQPFESHLQYLLQWMCDFNLYGCAYIDCKKARFRSPVPDYLEMDSLVHKWHSGTIRPEWISDQVAFQRQSHCSIEVDIRVEDILNRTEVLPRYLHQDFGERFENVAVQEKLIHSMAGLWKDETRRRKLRMGLTDVSSSPFPPEVLVSMSAESRTSNKGGWIHEEEYRQLINNLIKKEKQQSEGVSVNFSDFVVSSAMESEIQLASESVEDLFTKKLEESFVDVQRVPQEQDGIASSDPFDSVIDDDTFLKFNEEDFPYHSDEEVAKAIVLTQSKGLDERSNGTSLSSLQVGAAQKTSSNSNPIISGRNHLGLSTKQIKEPSLTSRSSFGVGPAVNAIKDEDDRALKKQKLRSNDQEARENQMYQTDYGASQAKLPEASGLSESGWGQSSQGSVKAHGSQGNVSRGFPVVKDPYDPETILSLSQREVLSNPMTSSQDAKRLSSSASKSLQCLSSSQKSLSMNSASLSSPKSDNSSEIKTLLMNLDETFDVRDASKQYFFQPPPPSADLVRSTMAIEGLPQVIYDQAYYSNEKDVPDRAREYAGREFILESSTVPYLASFDPTGKSPASFGEKAPIIVDRAKENLMLERQKRDCSLRNWEYCDLPPSRAEVEDWLRQENAPPSESEVEEDDEITIFDVEYDKIKLRPNLSQIDGPTQTNRHGFKFSKRKKSTSVRHETQYMSTMSLEIHVNSRANFVPNPEHDEIACIFWCLKSDEQIEGEGLTKDAQVGVLILSEIGGGAKGVCRHFAAEVEEEETELDLINRMVDIVRESDPDILTGYEVHNGSWGYMIERARLKYDYDLCDEFSRVKSQSHGRFGRESDRWGFNNTSTIRVTGRHMINIWRAMRSEVNLLQYTMENVVFHLLHKRIPHFTFQDLTTWYKSGLPRDLVKCLTYYISRVQLDLEILEANELIPRTSEQARLIGVDFFSVFSRGSQFKVESLMFRLAKPENYILVSPSRRQVGGQNALECLPLVMEPLSNFYTSPLLVLDFQSLYPSIMIAYNYCYSTCLGRIVSWRDQNKLGFADFQRQSRLLELVKDYINIAPNGMMYVSSEMRKSLLAKMLGEILETRVMVKSGMSVDKHDKTLQQLLNNRQLALKLLANVTYGYTSASFSGRMPCAEIADSIVQTARETLEKAIATIHSVTRWGAEVVYGDTDSLFVYLKGRTKDEAFDIGKEIAKTITDTNPRPVKLKFEKVYLPCVLLAKKRYVGFKYESKSQVEPEFDAKGIETVRRDGTPAEQKIEEKALKILFRTADLTQVKDYFQRQAMKVMLGKVSIQDFCFAREVKLGTYSDKGPLPPGALISTKRMLEDPRLEPQYGERVPYVVVTGAPGARLIDRCVSPETLLNGDGGLELDAEYYISKNLIPPLERIFNLVGANVRQWYDEMPKVKRIREVHTRLAPIFTKQSGKAGSNSTMAVYQPKRTLESYMRSSSCLICKDKLSPAPMGSASQICHDCLQEPSTSLYKLLSRLRIVQSKAAQLESICRSCSGIAGEEEVMCDSKDCPVFYSRTRARAEEGRVRSIVEDARGVLEKEQEGLEW